MGSVLVSYSATVASVTCIFHCPVVSSVCIDCLALSSSLSNLLRMVLHERAQHFPTVLMADQCPGRRSDSLT